MKRIILIIGIVVGIISIVVSVTAIGQGALYPNVVDKKQINHQPNHHGSNGI